MKGGVDSEARASEFRYLMDFLYSLAEGKCLITCKTVDCFFVNMGFSGRVIDVNIQLSRLCILFDNGHEIQVFWEYDDVPALSLVQTRYLNTFSVKHFQDPFFEWHLKIKGGEYRVGTETKKVLPS